MAIKKSFSPSNKGANRGPASRRPVMASRRPANRRPVMASRAITAGTSITAAAKNRNARPQSASQAKYASIMASLTPEQRAFTQAIANNYRRMGGTAITAATNTSNIAAKPDFMELLPIFTQKLLLLDVFGTVAMKSRQQLIPYFKVKTENTKGETAKGTILASPFVNAQGIDPNFTGKVVKNELISNATGSFTTGTLAYIPVLPGSVTVVGTESGVASVFTDDGAGNLVTTAGASAGTIDYATGSFTLSSALTLAAGDTVKGTYQYDNETVGPNTQGEYGASMGKIDLQLDEINLVASAREVSCYWSVYSAFAASQEYGANISEMSKEAAFGELTAELNTAGFKLLSDTAAYNPQYNWDASPVKSGSVVPSDYLNMFKLKLGQAAASIYQRTRLTQPNYLIVGTNAAEYIKMINGFKAATASDNVGPYKLGSLDQFSTIICDPNYAPNDLVMGCKSTDIRRNSALFGEYMPFTSTEAIGLANASVQQGYVSMQAMEVVNPDTLVKCRIIGTF